MSIHALRLCHHCAVQLSEDECLHYVFECHSCVMDEHELEIAVRRDPSHPRASRLSRRAVEVSAAAIRPSAMLRLVGGTRAA